jgi:hypothetical protein
MFGNQVEAETLPIIIWAEGCYPFATKLSLLRGCMAKEEV